MHTQAAATPEIMMENLADTMGMASLGGSDHTIGRCYVGDGSITRGQMWAYTHEDHFVVTKCDFVFVEDCVLHMPTDSVYLALRLDYANHLSPGKIVSFLEEKGGMVSSHMKKGDRVAYTEIMYFQAFYRSLIEAAFPTQQENSVEILRNMTGEHNWPADIFSIFSQVNAHDCAGSAAGLYYIGKAYELMSTLLAMGTRRYPRNESDYSRLTQVLAHIDRRAFEPIQQKDLVRIANMSSTKLKTLFRRFTGLSITDYISERRLDHASHLLSDTDLSIEAIAGQTGFQTPSGFATFFKKHAGISPLEYRKQMKFHCFTNPSDSGVFSPSRSSAQT
ncbi:MAG: helix-turn-helix domain-containing protein [Oscillospiraceae bacterium]